MLMMTVLNLKSLDPNALHQQVSQRLEQDGRWLRDAPVVVDVSNPEEISQVELMSAVDTLRGLGVNLVALARPLVELPIGALFCLAGDPSAAAQGSLRGPVPLPAAAFPIAANGGGAPRCVMPGDVIPGHGKPPRHLPRDDPGFRRRSFTGRVVWRRDQPCRGESMGDARAE